MVVREKSGLRENLSALDWKSVLNIEETSWPRKVALRVLFSAVLLPLVRVLLKFRKMFPLGSNPPDILLPKPSTNGLLSWNSFLNSGFEKRVEAREAAWFLRASKAEVVVSMAASLRVKLVARSVV